MNGAGMLPHQVEILHDLEGAGNGTVCAGTIISSYLILTVAGCLAGRNESLFKIRANGKNGNESQIRGIADVFSYAALDSEDSPFDVAVIQLNSELELENLHTSKIPYDHMSISDKASICHESGAHEVNAVVSSGCSQILEGKEEKNFICAEPVENPRASFVGNKSSQSQMPLIGSSLICSEVVFGILAINSTNGGKRVYTSVAKYSHWIRLVFEEEETDTADEIEEYADLAATSFGGKVVDQITSPVPYQLSIRFNGSHNCGGVILDKKTALSAAHCFDPNLLLNVTAQPFNLSSFVVVAGEQTLNEVEETEQIFLIEKLVKHPDYTHFLKGNDLAVIHIKGEFNFTDPGRVNNIWISSPSIQMLNFQEFNGTATGWGITGTRHDLSPVLQSIDLEFLEEAKCKRKWPFLTDSMLCGYSKSSNVCKGDSGGPLALKNYEDSSNTTKDLLVGISSFGPRECERQKYPNGFTNISQFYYWIAEERSNSLCFPCQFQCFNGQCIESELKCNNKFDCADGSDEKMCSSQTPRLDCKMNAGEMPKHQVEIYDFEGPAEVTLTPVCAGTIISSRFILTVASCLAGRNERLIKIRANGKNGNESQIRTIGQVFSYAALNSKASPFDVAVIQLNSELELDQNHTFKIRYDRNQLPADEDFSGKDFVCHEGGIRKFARMASSNCSEMLEGKEEKNFICAEPLKNPGAGFAGNENSQNQMPLIGSSLICSDVLYGILAINSSNGGENGGKRAYKNVAKYSHWIQLVFEEEEETGATSFAGKNVNHSKNPAPYQLSIRFNGRHICGGVILDQKTALSASHCFDPKYLKVRVVNMSNFTVVVGETNLNEIETAEQILHIEKLFIHPNYKGITKGNDLAVIWIKGAFNFTDPGRVNNIWISSPSTGSPSFQDFNGTAAGWDKNKTGTNGDISPVLQSVELEFLEQAKCKKVWGFSKDSMICGYSNSSNVCSTDSGGPLVLKNYYYYHGDGTTKDLLVGISSFGPKKCEEQDMPHGFTNLSWFYDWIEEKRSDSLYVSCKFQCFNGDYIDKELKCDQKFDCADGSDEKVCSAQTQHDETEKAGCKKQREELARQERERREELAKQTKAKLDEIKRTKTFPKYQKFDLRNRTSIQKAASVEVGSWGPVKYCSKDSIVTGFTVKFVPYRGSQASTGQIFAGIFSLGITSTIYAATNAFDDYGLVGISLYCTNVFNNTLTKEIRSDYFTDKDIADLNNVNVPSRWLGSFSDSNYNCPQRHPAIGFTIKNQPDQGKYDDFGAVNFNLICSGSQNVPRRPPPLQFDTVDDAKWSEDVICPDLMAICGLRTKVHRVHHKTDSAGLTDVELQCCQLVDF